MHPPYDRNDVYREVTERMCGNLDIDAALRQTLPYLASVMPADAIQLMAHNTATGVVRTVAAAGTGRFAQPVPSELVINERTSLYETLGPIFNRPGDIPPIRALIERFGFSTDMSVVSLPLIHENRQEGSVTITAEGTDRLERWHFELLQMLAVPMTIALTNAMRYEELLRLRDRLAEDNAALRRQLQQHDDSVLGADQGLRRVMTLLEQVAPMDSPVLLLGETGVGKEVIANALHKLSSRRGRSMVTLNCGAIPESLVDSELFGHEKGAFTGAIATRHGVFERADGGSLFLDEIGELPVTAQVKLLRVLQTMQFERVGGLQPITVNTRVIAATHRDLSEMVREGRFREDLSYRLNVFPIHIPPLRERKDDIPAMAQHFVETRAREMRLSIPPLTDNAVDQLIHHDWPGNVRELRNVIDRALIVSGGRPLSFPHLAEPQIASRPTLARQSTSTQTLDEAMTRHIQQVLSLTAGRIKGPGGAADLLGLAPSTLRNKMLRLGIGTKGN